MAAVDSVFGLEQLGMWHRSGMRSGLGRAVGVVVMVLPLLWMKP